jgi:hypothetical protein
VDILSYDYDGVPEREQGHEFTVSPGACRVRVYCGLYIAVKIFTDLLMSLLTVEDHGIHDSLQNS